MKEAFKMEYINITAKLGRLMLWYDYTIVCDDIKPVIVHCDDAEFGEVVQRQIELTNPVEYTQDELKEKFDLDATVIKWEHTFTDDGKEAMAVVLQKDE